MAWMNINHFPGFGMLNESVEDITDTYSKNCVISLELFICFFSLSLVM